MDKKITRHSRVPFGSYGAKGKKLCDQTDTFLRWIVNTLWDSDKQLWAMAAKKELEFRKKHKAELRTETTLESAADEFLKQHGIDPGKFK